MTGARHSGHNSSFFFRTTSFNSRGLLDTTSFNSKGLLDTTSFNSTGLLAPVWFQAVLGIRDILVRIQISGSIPLTNGSDSFLQWLEGYKKIFSFHIFSHNYPQAHYLQHIILEAQNMRIRIHHTGFRALSSTCHEPFLSIDIFRHSHWRLSYCSLAALLRVRAVLAGIRICASIPLNFRSRFRKQCFVSDPDSIRSVEPNLEPGYGCRRAKISCFEVLNVLFCVLKTSPVAWRSFMKA